ncbi:MAG TPA: nucleoside deaminase [Streptosporangiaceae bacterium]|jgi:tRNA(adenine34) deaminase
MSPEEAVALAADVADEGMRRGELPIGAVVLDGDAVIGRAHTGEKGLGRRIVHADPLAMIEADEFLGKGRSAGPLTLAVNLEPCIMCLGAAITLGVRRVWYGLESPDDGGAELLVAAG